jgi:protein TonB
MLAYAANRPRVGASQSSPNTLLLIACGHIALLAVAMSVKMALPPIVKEPPIVAVPIDRPVAPPPVDTKQAQHPTNHPAQPRIPQPAQDPSALPPSPPFDFGSTTLDPPAGGGTGTVPLPPLPPPPLPTGISRDAQLITSAADLRPPYPQSKLLAEQEATLRLRLTIDESGRVVAVDPVGRADPVFLASARRHLLSHWRYKPAMKDGKPVPSSIVISLRFQLDA